MNENANITRLKKGKAWRLSIKKKIPAIEMQKDFTDSTHGGENKALAAAKKYRDAIYKRAGYDPMRTHIHSKPRRGTITGRLGVSYIKGGTRQRDGRIYDDPPCYMASWINPYIPIGKPGRRARKRFTIQNYESKKYALEEATEYRIEMERRYGRHADRK